MQTHHLRLSFPLEHEEEEEDAEEGQIKGPLVSRVGPAESLGLTLHDTEVKDG